ncbi:hypothetical protein M422DRAFT_254326 [Sphaerobolus stellatus SS14]|uniref:Uncharacterized protein n=1 Tax=Sphaerobolus stellatus (strain SS14) TaxID=990650 RepID=A0A0C9VLE0_SPHS4|nr:hypothetical protein M422DRAFT_254326 [Sphaerobolus stellatus SS14]
MGDSKGGHPNTSCFLFTALASAFGNPVICYQSKISCCSIKRCDFRGPSHPVHALSVPLEEATRQTFEKTLAFYSVLISKGCHGFLKEMIEDGLALPVIEEDSYDFLNPAPAMDSRSKPTHRCKGDLLLAYGSDGSPFINSLHGDMGVLAQLDLQALYQGYGPLMSCNFVAGRREQWQLCPNFHRHPDETLREVYFPNGTGLQGAMALFEKQKLLPREEQYVRHVETFHLSNHKPFTIIICMLPAMSKLLMRTLRPTINTSFKRAAGYEEFELEAWFLSAMKSFVCCQCFTTSQSATAHLFLFRHIFKIPQEDTGRQIQFRHIHGVGFEVVAADAHRGQAQGLGKYLCEISHELTCTWTYECACPLQRLNEYDHLHHCLSICTNHVGQGIHKLGNAVTEDVKKAMYSLMSALPLNHVDATIALIYKGGIKAVAWMDDKITSKFGLQAIYQPASKIPLHIWQAAPSAIMRGLQYDLRALEAIKLFLEIGIYQRDQLPTLSFRSDRSVLRCVTSQKRKLDVIDSDLQETHKHLEDVSKAIVEAEVSPTKTLPKWRRVKGSPIKAKHTLSQLYSLREEIQAKANVLHNKSSGSIPQFNSQEFPNYLSPSQFNPANSGVLHSLSRGEPSHGSNQEQAAEYQIEW